MGRPAVAVRRARPPVRVRPGHRRADRPDGPALAGSPRVPGRPGAARGGDLVPARRAAWPRRSSRRTTRSSSRAASTRPTRRGRCVQDRPGVGIGAAHDIGPAIERAARGGRLEPGQFLEIADDPRRHGASGHAPRRRAAAAPARARARTSTRCRRCARRWRAASIRSASCSTRPRRGSAACARPFASPTTGCAAGWTRSSARSSAASLQEPIVTLRNGRYVVPVKAEARSRVKGIVHDASGSGQTLFIEPLVAVELGNAWREAQVAEAEEIARILDELSAFVAANADAAPRDPRRAGAVRPVGRQGDAGRGDGRRPGRDRRPARGRSCCRLATRA